MMPVLFQKQIEILQPENPIKASSNKQTSFEQCLVSTVFNTLRYMNAYKHYEDFQTKGLQMLNSQVKMMKTIFHVEYIQKNLLKCFEGVFPTMLEAMQNHQFVYIKKIVMSLTIDLVKLGMKMEASLCAKMTRMCLQSVKIDDKTEKMQQFACSCVTIFAPESLATEIFEAWSWHDSIGEVALVLNKSFDMKTKNIAVNCLVVLISLYNHKAPVEIFEFLFTEIYEQSDSLKKDNMPLEQRPVAFNIMTKAMQCVKIMLRDSNASANDYRAQLESMYYVPVSAKFKCVLNAIMAKNGNLEGSITQETLSEKIFF